MNIKTTKLPKHTDHRTGGLIAREKNLTKDPEFYKRIGSKGGRAVHTKPHGFAANPELARLAGMKGGRISKRRPSTKPRLTMEIKLTRINDRAAELIVALADCYGKDDTLTLKQLQAIQRLIRRRIKLNAAGK